MNHKAFVALFALILLTGCGGPSAGPPTALPPDAGGRPEQPTPAYADVPLRVEPPALTPAPPTVPAASTADEATVDSEVDASGARLDPITARLATPRPPTALGVAASSTALLDAPDGASVRTLPAGTTITATGRSGDGRYLAAYTGDATSGWVSVGAVRLFGDSDLTVVTASEGPGPIATLIADAMQPIELGAIELDAGVQSTVEALLTPSP